MKQAKTLATLLSLTLGTWLLACADAQPNSHLAERTDSAGVQLVMNSGKDRELAWSFAERFRLGGADSGPEAFYLLTPRNISVAANGDIYVLDNVNYRVVQFDMDGRLIRAFGSQGGGPGEFEFPAQVLPRHDGAVGVYDVGKGGLLWFDADGQYVDMTPWAVRISGKLALIGDSIVHISRSAFREGLRRTVSLRVALGSDTSDIASVVTPPMKSQFYQSCRVGISLPPVFYQDLVWDATQRAIAVNGSPAYTIDMHAAGQQTVSMRRNVPLRAATPELAAREVGEGMPLGIGSAANTCLIPAREVIEQRGIADAVPAIREIALQPDGTLWVQRWTFPDDEPRSDIFDPTGEYQGTIAGPHPFPVGFLPNGDILTIEKDEMDIQRLVAYQVEKGISPAR
jgi:hypothetical protein